MKHFILFFAITLVLFSVLLVGISRYSGLSWHEAKHKHIFEYAGMSSEVVIDFWGNDSKTIPDNNTFVPPEVLQDVMRAQMQVEASEPNTIIPIIQTIVLFAIFLVVVTKK